MFGQLIKPFKIFVAVTGDDDLKKSEIFYWNYIALFVVIVLVIVIVIMFLGRNLVTDAPKLL